MQNYDAIYLTLHYGPAVYFHTFLFYLIGTHDAKESSSEFRQSAIDSN